MPVRDKREELTQPEAPRTPRASIEREVEVMRAAEGQVMDGPVASHGSQGSQGSQGSRGSRGDAPATFPTPHFHHHHGHGSTGIRVLLVSGAVFAVLVPTALQHPEAPRIPDVELATMLMAMAALKAVATLVACAGVMWRLRRHASLGRRTGYLLGAWLMALGVGLIVSHSLPFSGALAYDVGLVLVLALAASDERLRRGRAH